MSNNSKLISAINDYESNDEKILCFKKDELFITIVDSNNEDHWLYVVNSSGEIGYIPGNFTKNYNLDNIEYLKFIENVINSLKSINNKNSNITGKQIIHVQVKLAELKCEINQRINKLNSSKYNKLDIIENDINNNEIYEINLQKHTNLEICSSNTYTQTDFENNTDCNELTIPENLILELIEELRLSTNLNFNVCKLALKTIIYSLKQKLPYINNLYDLILKQINCEENVTIDFIKKSSDYIKLKTLFKKLWHCKNDDQQLSWPTYQDEEKIKYLLDDIENILKNANFKISKEVICEKNYENVNLLINYFQIEHRSTLRMKLYLILFQIISIDESVISDIMLISVLPGCLCNEMINYKMDIKRWSLASKLFTAIFSTGHKPLTNIDDYINEQFINSLLDLIEEPNFAQNFDIPPELTIPPILAFNLHFDEKNDYNCIIYCLQNRQMASQLFQNLVSYLNWNEDPTKFSFILKNLNKNNDEIIPIIDKNQRQNSVHKLLLEMCEDKIIANLLYFNDICVMVDVLLTSLNNLQTGDKNKLVYLKLLLNICKNTSYKDEPHKYKEIFRCLKQISQNEQNGYKEIELAEQIMEIFNR